jgi:hypothetical protein
MKKIFFILFILFLSCSSISDGTYELSCVSRAVSTFVNQQFYHTQTCRIVYSEISDKESHVWTECYDNGIWKPLSVSGKRVVVDYGEKMGKNYKYYYNIIDFLKEIYKNDGKENLLNYNGSATLKSMEENK